MSKAIKCDRCGGFDVPRQDGKVQVRSMKDMNISVHYDWGSSGKTKKTDLCANCIKSLVNWWMRRKSADVPA